MLPFCHVLSYASNRKKSFTKITFNIFHMRIFICHMLSVIHYLWLAICYFFSETCYYLQKRVPFARCTSRNFLFLIFFFQVCLPIFFFLCLLWFVLFNFSISFFFCPFPFFPFFFFFVFHHLLFLIIWF